MDVQKLINLVRDRKAIWNAGAKKRSNRDDVRKLWEEIGNSMGVSREVAKNKWRSIRENYRKELGKIKTGQETGGNWQSKWTYFDSMSFLQDEIVIKPTSGNAKSKSPGIHEIIINPDNIYSPESSCEDNQDNNGENIQQKFDRKSPLFEELNSPVVNELSIATFDTPSKRLLSQSSFEEESQSATIQHPQKKSKTSLLEKMVRIEESKVKQFVKQATSEVLDADYHFIMSLLPALKAVPPHRKMIVRRKLEDVFIQEGKLS